LEREDKSNIEKVDIGKTFDGMWMSAWYSQEEAKAEYPTVLSLN